MKEEYSNLEQLKEKYEILKSNYNLPEFSELNSLFDLEEIDTDTEFLLKKIRRIISEKINHYLRFVEIILNPSNTPIFFYKLLKKLESEDKENLGEIYEKLGKIELKNISLDLDYSEKSEAEFIKKTYQIFTKEMKPKILEIVEKMNGPEEIAKKINGSYFG